MRLIAKKPCQFGGKKFYIGEEIPEELVTEPKTQERLGVIAIANNESAGVSGEQSGTLYTQEQLDEVVAEVRAELEEAVAKLEETEPGAYEGTVLISVKGTSDGDNEQVTAIPATPEEIQQVFSIMQMNATDGAEAIAGVKSENVLILLHAADTRKTIKDAAKKQADIFSTSGSQNESIGGNETTGTNTEGADT